MDVVIPTIGIVIGNDDDRVAPLRSLLDDIDRMHKECLLIQRIGVAGVAVAISGGLKKADGGKVSGLYRVEKIVNVVLVVCIAVICVPDHLYGSGTGMQWVRGGSIILKRIEKRIIVERCLPGDVGSVASPATRGAIAVGHRDVETLVEEAPGYACLVQ